MGTAKKVKVFEMGISWDDDEKARLRQLCVMTHLEDRFYKDGIDSEWDSVENMLRLIVVDEGDKLAKAYQHIHDVTHLDDEAMFAIAERARDRFKPKHLFKPGEATARYEYAPSKARQRRLEVEKHKQDSQPKGAISEHGEKSSKLALRETENLMKRRLEYLRKSSQEQEWNLRLKGWAGGFAYYVNDRTYQVLALAEPGGSPFWRGCPLQIDPDVGSWEIRVGKVEAVIDPAQVQLFASRQNEPVQPEDLTEEEVARMFNVDQVVPMAEIEEMKARVRNPDPNARKCAVKGCTNHTNEGEFKGEFCMPCYMSMTTGVVGTHTPIVNGILHRAIKQAGQKPLTFSRLRHANVARCSESFYPFEERTPENWLCAVMGELGEISQLLYRKFTGIKHDPDQFPVLLRKEFADVMAYLDLFAASCGVDLGQATIEKFNEVSERVGSEYRL